MAMRLSCGATRPSMPRAMLVMRSATVTGKADNGQHAGLSPRFARFITGVVVVWTSFTLVIYGMVLSGGFVKQWGRDNSFTLKHYITAFGVDFDHASGQHIE